MEAQVSLGRVENVSGCLSALLSPTAIYVRDIILIQNESTCPDNIYLTLIQQQKTVPVSLCGEKLHSCPVRHYHPQFPKCANRIQRSYIFVQHIAVTDSGLGYS